MGNESQEVENSSIKHFLMWATGGESSVSLEAVIPAFVSLQHSACRLCSKSRRITSLLQALSASSEGTYPDIINYIVTLEVAYGHILDSVYVCIWTYL